MVVVVHEDWREDESSMIDSSDNGLKGVVDRVGARLRANARSNVRYVGLGEMGESLPSLIGPYFSVAPVRFCSSSELIVIGLASDTTESPYAEATSVRLRF